MKQSRIDLTPNTGGTKSTDQFVSVRRDSNVIMLSGALDDQLSGNYAVAYDLDGQVRITTPQYEPKDRYAPQITRGENTQTKITCKALVEALVERYHVPKDRRTRLSCDMVGANDFIITG